MHGVEEGWGKYDLYTPHSPEYLAERAEHKADKEDRRVARLAQYKRRVTPKFCLMMGACGRYRNALKSYLTPREYKVALAQHKEEYDHLEQIY